MTKARTLADFISDGSPLADGTISVAEVSGAAPLASPTFTGTVTVPNITTTGDISFGANDKAIFNNILEVYHSGSHSYITENSTGDLYIQGTNIGLRKGDGTQTYLYANAGGSVDIKYNNATKLQTTASGAAITGKTTTDELDLNALAATISDTAVDIFVYDTRKDSDGGAWRKRTQHTSWYNEAASSTRGSRKEFPAVAVIVAESDTVTIYDGDDPDLPMWFVFDDIDAVAGTGSVCTGVTALNGSIVISRNNTGFGLEYRGGVIEMSFAADYMRWLRGFAVTDWYVATPLTNRMADDIPDGSGVKLVNGQSNDVAMTVLPNAPIDAATGLPVPTIAVATDGGVSVIKDDGTVVDITHTASTNNGATDISFNGNQISYATQQSGSSNNYWRKAFIDIPSADVTGSYTNNISGITVYDARGTNSNSGVVLNTNSNLGDATNNIKAAVHDKAVGFTNKLTLLDIDYYSDAGTPSASGSMVAYASSDYNTGWMNGQIKLATLSDTDDTDVTGSDLAPANNAASVGSEANATTGWSSEDTSTFESSSSQAFSGTYSIHAVSNANGGVVRNSSVITLEVGKKYTASCAVYVANGDADTGVAVRYGTANDGSTTYGISSTFNSASWNVYTRTFTATSTSFWIYVGESGAGNDPDFYVDAFSVRLAEEDRSVNGNGLQVFGTVTKNPVATGADLVKYGIFSGSNYLYQPPNADMIFGTGDFNITFWYNRINQSTHTVLDHYNYTGNNDNRIQVQFLSSGDALRLVVGSVFDTSGFVTYNTWNLISIVRSSGTLMVYQNGVLLNSTSNTANIGTSASDIHVGVNNAQSQAFNGYLALLRISATAPSPEQIKKIYEDEKVLFQENAQATLYGSSDAVTALAYDDSTELLHVGTSAGRSVFQGLRRVDNTTDAVGAAISASNGLVADE